MKLAEQTKESSQPIGWRLSDQHQLALALLATLALAGIGLCYGWSVWEGDGDIDQAKPITLKFQVDVNQAGVGELMAVPSVGPKMAEAIVAYRDLHGPFDDLDRLQEVSGIGPKKLEHLKKYLLPLD